jgi:hypothetical protein
MNHPNGTDCFSEFIDDINRFLMDNSNLTIWAEYPMGDLVRCVVSYGLVIGLIHYLPILERDGFQKGLIRCTERLGLHTENPIYLVRPVELVLFQV